jgi:hypothetical protein
MTHVTIPNRPTPQSNRDINAILANFDAITKVINGELGGDNLENESINLAKIEKGLFLELAVGGEHRKVKFGSLGSKVGLDAQAGRSSLNDSFVHGLGATPIFALICAGSRVAIQEQPGYTVVPSFAIIESTATEIKYAATVNGTSNNGVAFFWLAIA